MNLNPKISVIVPIYNVEPYLEKCLLSIAHQTFKDFEVIMVNDGSPDGSALIAEKFVERYSNFKLISQPNMGLGCARNRGLELAKGEYVAFIDSDDCIKPDYLEKLYNAAVQNGADIAICGFEMHWLKTDIKVKNFIKKRPGVYDAKEILKCLIRDLSVQFYVWNKLFKRSLFSENGIWYPRMRFEDIGTLPRVFYSANKVAVIPDYLYVYSKRKNSIISQLSEQNLNDYVRSLCMLRLFLEEEGCYGEYEFSFKMLKAKAGIAVYPWTMLLHKRSGSFDGFFANFKSLKMRLKEYSQKQLPDNAEEKYLFPAVLVPKALPNNKKAEKRRRYEF